MPTNGPTTAGLDANSPQGMDALGGDDPFIMIADGKCLLFVPSGLKDGPLPTHYEPVEIAGKKCALRPAGQSGGEDVGAAGQRST